MTEHEIRSKVTATAAKYLGTKEGSAAHKEIIRAYNSHSPLPRGFILKVTDPWCAGFTSAIAVICEMTDVVPVECSCSKLIALAKAKGIWREADNYIPKPADLILYDWGDDGKGECTGDPEHVGYVDHVADSIIYVTEGNYNNAVGTRPIEINGRYIRGFITPDYASKADLKTVDELAQEVIKGLWGNGEARKAKLTAAGYDAKAVQDRVNELMVRTYKVKEHDTLWRIAEKELGNPHRFPEIMELNNLKNDIIHAGQVLKLPKK